MTPDDTEYANHDTPQGNPERLRHSISKIKKRIEEQRAEDIIALPSDIFVLNVLMPGFIPRLSDIIQAQVSHTRSQRITDWSNKLTALKARFNDSEYLELKKAGHKKYSSRHTDFEFAYLSHLLKLRKILRRLHKEMLIQSPEYKDALFSVSSQDENLPKFLNAFLYPIDMSRNQETQEYPDAK